MENKETFQARIKPYLPPSQQLDVKLAYCLAKFGHRAQTRKELTEGKPTRYFEHVRRVAIILMDEVKMVDRDMVIAALLHDSLEDTHDLSAELLEHCFGAEVITLVKLLSKVPKEGYIERLNHCQDWKVLLIKACDRLDNLRSLMVPGTTLEFQKKQIKETKECYFPIFDRLMQLAPLTHYPNITIVRDEIKRLVERYNTIIEIAEQKKKNACVICQGQGWYPAPDDENMVECFCQKPKENVI
jgi:(p)ppGpp synthase/HD superfamily hydrolase